MPRTQYQISYYQKNKEKIKSYRHLYYLKNKEKELQRNRISAKKWARNNLEKVRETNKKYRLSERGKEKRRLQEIRRRRTPKGRYGRYKSGAKTRGLLFNLTFDQFMNFWQKPCYYCGNKIETIGLDRINSKLGYLENNIVPCCKTCNKAKRILEKETFIKMCKAIANRF